MNNYFFIKRFNKKIEFKKKKEHPIFSLGRVHFLKVKMKDNENYFFLIHNLMEFCFRATLDYWNENQYLKNWKKGFEYLNEHNISCIISSINRYKKRNINNIWVHYLCIIDNSFIGVKDETIERDELKKIFKNANKIQEDDWKKLIPKKKFSSICDYTYFIPLLKRTDEKKYLIAEKIIQKEKDIIVICNKNICNIKIGIFDKQIEKFPYNYDIFLFLDHYIITSTSRYGSWDIDNYKKQWEHGLKHLEKNDQSCLVTDISCFKDGKLFMMRMVCLYKKNPYIIVNSYTMYFNKESATKDGLMQKNQLFDCDYFYENVGTLQHATENLHLFYKLIPPLKLTKKSEYLVIDDLIET